MAGNVKANLEALSVEVCLLTQSEPITKTRYVEETRNHCLLRMDEDPLVVQPFDWGVLDRELPLVVSDYNKGFVSFSPQQQWQPLFNCFLDTKKPLDRWCLGFDFIKLNEIEYEVSRGFVEKYRDELRDKLIVTHGAEGCTFRGVHYPVEPVQVLDVTGAGDTFFAAFIAMYLASNDPVEAVKFANDCAHQVVQKRGTSVVAGRPVVEAAVTSWT
jgi:D-glycero-beta-D-manno-heptose-7-phosphate kinase